ncbi:MAG: hypothetical protein AAF571_09450 [Verrucomicrobiota bacterium]
MVAKICLISGLVLISIFSAEARLGENKTQLEERFGAPAEIQQQAELGFVQHLYENFDLLIGVTLIDGKSAAEQYTRTTGKKNSEGKPILTAIPMEIAQAILNANAEGGTWKQIGIEDGARRFVRSDDEAIAVFFEGKGAISEIRVSYRIKVAPSE